jgi:hypothetical protein
MHLDGKPPRHLCPQVNALPTDDAIGRRIGAADHQVTQLGLLRLAQIRLAARALPGFQTRHARRVVAMYLVAQSLPIHAIEGGRFAARPTLQHQRQGKHATHLRAIGALAANARNSALVWCAQVIFNVAPIDPPKRIACSGHRIRFLHDGEFGGFCEVAGRASSHGGHRARPH